MEQETRIVSVLLKNEELDALEDYLTRDYEGDFKLIKEHRHLILSLWGRLCNAYDKPIEEEKP